MADCSKTLDFSREFGRMCDHYGELYDCEGCPLQRHSYQCDNRDLTQEVIDIVQKWSDEHPDIKPCPFCGKSDTVEIGRDGENIYAFCCTYNDGCGASTGYCDTEEEAWKLWNKRVGVE